MRSHLMEKRDSCFIATEKCPLLFIHFVVFLHSFLIGEALLPLYAVKKSFNISTIFINYQKRVIAVYINYGSRPSPHYAFMFHGCITSSDMKYLL